MPRISDFAVSVVIPTYNRVRFIARSIESVLAAIDPGDEIIVVDDGSTDGTGQVLERFGEPVRVVRGPHRGCGAARNAGIDAATRPLIAFNDSDDEWMPDHLRMKRAFMRLRSDVLFCFSDFGTRHEDGRGEGRRRLVTWHGDPRPWGEILGPGAPYSSMLPLPSGRPDFTVHVGDLYPAMIRANYVAVQTALVWRERAGEALRFPEDVKIHEDHECFARVARLGSAAYFDCETFWQWGHTGPRVSGANDVRWSSDRITMYERVWGADEAYLANHRETYEAVVSKERAALGRALLRTGRPREARSVLRRSHHVPFSLRAMSIMPEFMVRVANGLRRLLGASGAVVLAKSLVACILERGWT